MIKEILERKKLRDKLLIELYEYHFSNEGKGKSVVNEIKDVESKLAYFYFADKGFVVLDQIDHPVFGEVKITSLGIDYVEENHLSINKTKANPSIEANNSAKAFTQW